MIKVGCAMGHTDKADDFRVVANGHRPILLLLDIERKSENVNEQPDQIRNHHLYQHLLARCP
jgi:hypothetical protein